MGFFQKHRPACDFQAFIDLLKANDQKAWTELYTLFRGVVWNWLVQQGQNSATADEIYQKTMITVYMKLGDCQFKDLGEIRSYIFTVALYKLKEEKRSFRLARHVELDQAEQKLPLALQQDPVLENFKNELEASDLLNALTPVLQPYEWEVLIAWAQGDDFRTIAVKQDKSPLNCRKIKERSIKKLKRHMKANGL